MFVAADIEWVKIPVGLDVPTQLAASRVDETWNVISTFHSFIKPLGSVFDNRGHVALNGGSPSDFINAPDAYIVLADFLEWLDDDDIILWWHHESDSLFKKLVGNIREFLCQRGIANLVLNIVLETFRRFFGIQNKRILAGFLKERLVAI